MSDMYSPIRLEVVRIDKLKVWERDGRSGQIVHLYGKLRNEDPDFPLFFVVFAPTTLPVIPGSSFAVPISGIRITLGDSEVPPTLPPFVNNQANKKIP
jgi:hypothetical protein